MNRLTQIVFVLIFAFISKSVHATEPPRCYYQVRIFHYKTAAQQVMLDQYFREALKPALARAGSWGTGVYKTLDNDTVDRRFYVLICFPHKKQLDRLEDRLKKDEAYQRAAKDFMDAPYDKAPFDRMELITLLAFSHRPIPGTVDLPGNKTDHIYELRSYESPTEKYHQSKLKMFEEGGEIYLFSRLQFNAVFYADVLQGSHMPNLMYMTAFENKTARDKHWEAFFHSPEWLKLTADHQYDHNVSKADITFLRAMDYSDF